ncbi:hypothetical protein Gotur_008408 [Gossypium turneri]
MSSYDYSSSSSAEVLVGSLKELDDIVFLLSRMKTRDEPIESSNSKVSGEDASKVVPKSPTNDVHDNVIAWKGEGRDGETSEYMETSGEANMEVSLTTDDVIRAGGFGARDDIGSFLPVASDSTDFEASIRDARDYEEPQGDIHRPGLGWREASEREKL